MTPPFPNAAAATSLGTLDATYKALAAGEKLYLSVTNGATAKSSRNVAYHHYTSQMRHNTGAAGNMPAFNFANNLERGLILWYRKLIFAPAQQTISAQPQRRQHLQHRALYPSPRSMTLRPAQVIYGMVQHGKL